MELNTTACLYTQKAAIKLLNGIKKTNTLAPAGCGLSKFRPSGTTSPAKLSNIALVLDKIFVEKSVAARAIVDGVYVEYTANGIRYFAVCDGDSMHFVDNAPEADEDKLVPWVIYNLKTDDRTPEMQEFCDAFLTIASKSSSSIVDISDVALACDSFYYGITKRNPETIKIATTLTFSQLQQFADHGNFKVLATFAGIEEPAIKGFTESTESNETVSDEENAFDSIRNGKYKIPYSWDEVSLVNIPDISTLDDFVPSDIFCSIVKKCHFRMNKVLSRLDAGMDGVNAIGRDYVNFMLTGRPGTGKTTVAYALGAATGMPVYTVPITKNTEEDTFSGLTKVVDGKLQFVSTDFLYAYEHGGIVVLEEINLVDSGVTMGMLGQAIEFPFILKKNGSETIRRHPMCIIIATMNNGTYGSKGVNQALSSRFKQSYRLDDPKKEDFCGVLQSVGGASAGLSEWIYDAYTSIISALKDSNAEDMCLVLTLRGCLGAIECIEEGANPKDAIRDTLIGKISEVEDAEGNLAASIYEDVVLNLRDYRGKK